MPSCFKKTNNLKKKHVSTLEENIPRSQKNYLPLFQSVLTLWTYLRCASPFLKGGVKVQGRYLQTGPLEPQFTHLSLLSDYIDIFKNTYVLPYMYF